MYTLWSYCTVQNCFFFAKWEINIRYLYFYHGTTWYSKNHKTVKFKHCFGYLMYCTVLYCTLSLFPIYIHYLLKKLYTVIVQLIRGVNKDSVEGGKYFECGASPKIFVPPLRIFFTPPPLEKYHDVYQIIGFSWVWFEFSTHFWHLQTPSNKGFISYLSAFILFHILHYSHSFYINYKDL